MIEGLTWFVATVLFYGFILTYPFVAVGSAVLTAVNGKWPWFWLGFVTLGMAWLFGAAETLKAPARAVLILVGVFLALGFTSARPALLFGVDGESLQNSVDRLFAESNECRPAGDNWICSSYDSTMSGDREYRIDVDWAGCWEGEPVPYSRETSGPEADERIDGCITLKDLI